MLDGAEPGREERIAALCTEQPEPSTALTCASQGADSSRTETFHRGENTSLFLYTEGPFVLGKQAQEMRTRLTSSPGRQKDRGT